MEINSMLILVFVISSIFLLAIILLLSQKNKINRKITNDKLFLYLKTWYQETPNVYYFEEMGEFDTYREVAEDLQINIDKYEDLYPIVEIIISRTTKPQKMNING